MTTEAAKDSCTYVLKWDEVTKYLLMGLHMDGRLPAGNWSANASLQLPAGLKIAQGETANIESAQAGLTLVATRNA